MTPIELIKYWEQAIKQPRGLKIKTSDRTLLRQQLYRARDTLGEDQFSGLAIVFPDKDGELWILHKDQ